MKRTVSKLYRLRRQCGVDILSMADALGFSVGTLVALEALDIIAAPRSDRMVPSLATPDPEAVIKPFFDPDRVVWGVDFRKGRS